MNPLSKSEYSKTAKFIIPLAFDDNVTYLKVFTKDFINAYSADINKPEHDDFDKVLLVYNRSKRSLSQYEHYKLDNNNYVYILPVREEFLQDVALIFIGQYSAISEDAKQRILSFWQEPEHSELYGVLNKQPALIVAHTVKEAKTTYKEEEEIYPPFDFQEEILGM